MKKTTLHWAALLCLVAANVLAEAPASCHAGPADTSAGLRQAALLSDAPWKFIGAKSVSELPKIQTADFDRAAWENVTVPHVFQTRQHFLDHTAGWCRRSLTVTPEMAGRQIYLVFEGAVPAQLFSRKSPAGEVHVASPDRDAIVLIKE